MRNKTERRSGFTLTELSVLVAVGGILSALLVADLSQTRAKLLQQACAANLKQWGMAISLYTQDYNGTYYYGVVSFPFDDSTDVTGTVPNPYLKYFGGGDARTTITKMRTCPFVAAALPGNTVARCYSMAVPTVKNSIGSYQVPSQPSPFVDSAGNYWPSVKFLRFPSQYLLLIDSGGHTLHCGNLHNTVSGANSIPLGDTTQAIDRHPGGVNCLFGDFHIESETLSNIVAQDAISCGAGNPWFMMN